MDTRSSSTFKPRLSATSSLKTNMRWVTASNILKQKILKQKHTMKPSSLWHSMVVAGVLALTFGGTTSALAETITIPVGDQAPEQQQLARPEPGMTAAAVKQAFGTPLRQTPAVGNPPISRWVYQPFVVFFEGDLVIHTVLKPTLANSEKPGAESTTHAAP